MLLTPAFFYFCCSNVQKTQRHSPNRKEGRKEEKKDITFYKETLKMEQQVTKSAMPKYLSTEHQTGTN